MRLNVYKGFNEEFLSHLGGSPLSDAETREKFDVLSFDRQTRRKLDVALLNMQDNDEAWITYEEYTLIRTRIDEAITEDGLKLIVYRNNTYPDYYPLPIEYDQNLLQEAIVVTNGDRTTEASEECKKITDVYSSVILAEDEYFVGYYNYEYDVDSRATVIDYYQNMTDISEEQIQGDYNVFLNEDIESYLRDLVVISRTKPSIIGLKTTDGNVGKRMLLSLRVFCAANEIKLVTYNEELNESKQLIEELKEIARTDIGIRNFEDFRKIKFYKNPDISKETVEISQGTIIQEIIKQAENAFDEEGNKSFRDIFITASTGAGKSVMFQVPAVYLAKKYNKLTIIIEPVKALMQDQKERLNQNGYYRVEAFNSDLITQVEKEAALKRIKEGEVDLLYLSPETLLSYSIETIIGDREIGLLIVDEAHTVTTWGIGFRPDYWYLGGYINRLRNQIRTSQGKKRKVYHFPVCAFTATAINGGVDDSVSDTIVSLYMENPVKYLGYVRRDNIGFDIASRGPNNKLPQNEYEEAKTKALDDRIKGWLENNEKTIVYFPYASQVREAANGLKGFAGITVDKRIGTYTGRNINDSTIEVFNETKREAFEGFRNGSKPIMMATKAFGMGVDVEDIDNVYHYAVTGNLCDYVQEVGRAARKSTMTGTAITDYYYNDMSFMKRLFGMSQIRQYQIKEVLECIYNIHKSKNYARSFLISPESFTYIFNGKGVQDEESCINKLKTTLLMLEKDFYDKYNFKVIVSRPQSVFTKAYVCIQREEEKKVLSSKYGKFFKFTEKGRQQEKQANGTIISDMGDIYTIDLEEIWEQFHQNISFPQFKYWYFNADVKAKDKVNVMPEIRKSIAPRQKVTIEAWHDLKVNELRQAILDDFEFIGDELYASFKNQFFSSDDFIRILKDRFGRTNARIIANSLFDLVDPDGRCVKRRTNEGTGKTQYSLAFGNFKEYMRRPILRSRLIANATNSSSGSVYTSYISLLSDEVSSIALKLLSIFDYITYEVVGGEQPEIFIRLNDPNKVKNIVFGNAYYSNDYVTKAKLKHDRDVDVLMRFFKGLNGNKERWDYIEDYFLGQDELQLVKEDDDPIKMTSCIDKEHSYSASTFDGWRQLISFFDDTEHSIINKLNEEGVCKPEYLETQIKKSDIGDDIMMSWPSRDVLVCQRDTSDVTMRHYEKMGWHAYRIHEIDYQMIKEYLS